MNGNRLMVVDSITIHSNNQIVLSGKKYVSQETNVPGLHLVGDDVCKVDWFLQECTPVHVFAASNHLFMSVL